MITIRSMDRSEVPRIAEIDRSEHVTTGYVYEHGELRAEFMDWRVPRWPPTGDGFSVEHMTAGILPVLDSGGTMLGAFEENGTLVGFGVWRYGLAERMAQLDAIFVSNGYRRKGIATKLLSRIVGLARADGADWLYVSATPSESAVGFYVSQGFHLAEELNEDLYLLEPEDIHMIRSLVC